MRNTIAATLASVLIGGAALYGDVSEMVFYPASDFSEGLMHFNYQGERHKNYGFMFEKGFDSNRIVYVRPENHAVEKTAEGNIKLSFKDTDRYAYVQKVQKEDFLISESKGIMKVLLSGGDCKGSANCTTAENILTINVPKGYDVRKYQGLDQDLKPLLNPRWQTKGSTYTLTAHNVKGACILMELEKLKPGQKPTVIASASNLKVPAQIDPTPIISPKVPLLPPEPVIVTKEPIVKPADPIVVPNIPVEPVPYFRNFQLFDNRVVALNEAGKERLREWAKQFKSTGKKTIIINSYTDDIPPQRLKHLYATNEILAEARGRLVAEYLATQGIDLSAITVNGMGDTDPVASNETEEGRSKNRRVEFILN